MLVFDLVVLISCLSAVQNSCFFLTSLLPRAPKLQAWWVSKTTLILEEKFTSISLWQKHIALYFWFCLSSWRFIRETSSSETSVAAVSWEFRRPCQLFQTLLICKISIVHNWKFCIHLFNTSKGKYLTGEVSNE